MKSIKIAFAIMTLGMLVSVTSCNTDKTGSSAGMDSSSMDNTQSQMETDTMATDSAAKTM